MRILDDDENGLIVCPNCGKHYRPVLDEKMRLDRPNEFIQDVYPDAKDWEREQLLSGICSHKCWLQYLSDYED